MDVFCTKRVRYCISTLEMIIIISSFSTPSPHHTFSARRPSSERMPPTEMSYRMVHSFHFNRTNLLLWTYSTRCARISHTSDMPFLDINGRSLHYCDTHPSSDSNPPRATIVTVHGLGSSQNYFFPILPNLSSYRVIAFDNYGAGRSKYDGQEHSIASIGQDALGLMDALHVERAVIVGYSMGGMVPSMLASTAPERVLAGVCIGPVNPSEAVAEVFKKRIPMVQEGH
jgi:pimeloyl-ACP methyl ester carboxylesterase